MKIEAPLLAQDIAAVPAEVREIERLGFDSTFTFEGAHDPFFPLVVAAEHSQRLELATAIAIAFPRSPLHLAHIAHDLQVFSKGRFVLGLGSQIKAHIEKRFSATWSRPAARMREMVQAIRAIWRCWNEGEKLDFRGEFYRHTLMTPFFSPGPTGFGPPRIFLAGVGRPMTRTAGEVADGLFVHPFNSPDFIRGTTLPSLEEGFARGGHTRNGFEISCQAILISGFSAEEIAQAEMGARMQLAFYASTPQYKVVLDTHGWGDVQPELNMLSKQGKWAEMGKLIDDRMLDTFTVRCEPREIPARVASRFGGLVDRVAFICHAKPQQTNPELWKEIVAACRKA